MNNVSIIGRLTKDPDVRHTQNGVAVTSFTLAVDRPVQKDAEKETDYLPCVAWRSLADFAARYMHKGQRFGVTGSIRVRSCADKDGKRVYVTEIHADHIYFADGKGGNAQVYGNARVCDNAQVWGNARVWDNAEVYGTADVRSNAKVYGTAEVYDNAKVYGNATVSDYAKVYCTAKVYGNAEVYGYAQVQK